MILLNNLARFFAIIFSLCVFIVVYRNMSKGEIKIDLFRIMLFLVLSIIEYIGDCYLDSNFKIFISCFVMISLYKVFFDDKLKLMFIKFFIIYVIVLICDFLVSTIYLFFPIYSSTDVVNIPFLRALCTILLSLILLMLFLFPRFVKFLNKLLDYIVKKWNVIFLILSSFIFIIFLVLTYLSFSAFNLKMYIVTMLLLTFFLFLCIVMISQYFKNKHNEEEQKSLLELMNEYEKVLDNERINRHEMLNNLIILKSYSDKSSKEYEDTLDEIIKSYEDKKSLLYSNLYKLPSGVKGIIYYKMSKIKENNINLNLFSAPNIEENFERLNPKLYFKVCKILGIVLDNAIEATSVTEDKNLLIDIYYDEALVVYIENSFSNSVDLNTICKKGISTKGKNRGYGLYIVNKMIEETKSLYFEQFIENNNFVTILKIKNPSD